MYVAPSDPGAMTDLNLMRWYEVVRLRPRSVESARAARELERRARANGGVLIDSDKGMCFVWDESEQSLVRRELKPSRKHRVPAGKPHVFRFGTVVPQKGHRAGKSRRRGQRRN